MNTSTKTNIKSDYETIYFSVHQWRLKKNSSLFQFKKGKILHKQPISNKEKITTFLVGTVNYCPKGKDEILNKNKN
jgi:hypothetical protein